MARRRDGNKTYKSGDPIHIVVTQDFVEDANRFFCYCRDRGYNPSQVIRQAMSDWLGREEGGQENVMLRSKNGNNGNNGPPTNDLDEKLIDLLQEKPVHRSKKGMSLRTVKEILEGN
jgi:hypothetical protein